MQQGFFPGFALSLSATIGLLILVATWVFLRMSGPAVEAHASSLNECAAEADTPCPDAQTAEAAISGQSDLGVAFSRLKRTSSESLADVVPAESLEDPDPADNAEWLSYQEWLDNLDATSSTSTPSRKMNCLTS